MPKALIMAGGTGGHIFPALALANALREQGWAIQWLGTADRLEATVVPKHKFPIHYLPVKGMRGKGLVKAIKGVWAVGKSILSARRLIKGQTFDVAIGFGGYPSFPGGVAARLTGCPLIIHEQNAVPGLTNKLLGRIAKQVFVGFPLAQSYFEAKGVEARFIGNPIRGDITFTEHDEQQRPFRLLVVGGSLGARPLNQIVPTCIPSDKAIAIRHQCGAGNQEDVLARYQQASIDAEVSPFIDDMAEAYRWADGIVCRAGALTVAEVAKAGRAACFVPLPHAVDDHQTKNAQYLQTQGAAALIAQSDLQQKLPETLQQWVSEPVLCRKMGRIAAQSLPSDATEHLVAACRQYIEE